MRLPPSDFLSRQQDLTQQRKNFEGTAQVADMDNLLTTQTTACKVRYDYPSSIRNLTISGITEAVALAGAPLGATI